MVFGKNLQYLRQMCGMTQEALAEKLDVSRQTVSKWEMDAAQPETEKAIELCEVFRCTLDNLFREDLSACARMYSDLRVETVPSFRYVPYTVLSTDPETDALERVARIARENGDEQPRRIGWDFPFLTPEQTNVYRMHGYTAAWIVPDGMEPEGMCVNPEHRYAAIHIEHPFEDPFSTIPNAYKTLMEYMRVNGLEHCEKGVIPCYETDGETMDVFIACE